MPLSQQPPRKVCHYSPSSEATSTNSSYHTRDNTSTLSLRVFPRFSELPVEIQILIWSFASNPEGPLHLTDRFIGTIYVNNPNHQPLDLRFFRHKPYFLFQPKPPIHEVCVAQLAELAGNPSKRSANVTMARRALMKTSSLARQISLESWIKDVQGMHIGKSKTNSRIHVELYPEGKEAIVELLRGLIAHDGSRAAYCSTNGFIEEEKEKSNSRSGPPASTDDLKAGDGAKMAKSTRNSRRRKRKLNALKEHDGANEAKSFEGEGTPKKKHVPAAVARKHTKQKSSSGPACTDVKEGESRPLHAFYRNQARLKGTREFQL